MECIFCSIVEKKIPAKIRWEDERWMVIDDIHPKAKTHVLLVSKAHLASLGETGVEHAPLVESALGTVKLVADTLGLNAQGYKTVINSGRGAGQIVDHLHIHIVSGDIQAGI